MFDHPEIDPLHDKTVWHAFDGTHHHGVNPHGYIPYFGETLINYLSTYGEIGFPWATSATEEHEGYTWLFTSYRGPVDQGKQDFAKLGVNTIKHALLQIHTTGTMHHLRKRFHSHFGFFIVEDPNGNQGVVATGGWGDYGIMHNPYKDHHCPLPSDPPGFTNLNQAPYRATQIEFRNNRLVHFWNAQKPLPVVAKYFPDKPANVFGLAWNTLDGLEYPGADCGDDTQDKQAVHDGNRQFQIFTLVLDNLPKAPFNGWTNRFGHLVTPTGTPGIDEVPLIVTAGTPTNAKAMINRIVKHGDANAAPIMVF